MRSVWIKFKILQVINYAAERQARSFEIRTSLSRGTLPASLKDDRARMNDRIKHKVTGQINQRTADPKANASVFLFFPKALFSNNFSRHTFGTFGFARNTSRPFAKPKEPNRQPHLLV